MINQYTPEPRSAVVRRRLVTIPRSVLFLVLLVALAPVLIPVALVIDLARWLARRKPAMTVRLLAIGWAFFAIELVGLIRLLFSWLRSGMGVNGAQLRAETWPIQSWWATTLWGVVKRVFRLELVVVGADCVVPGPIIAMFRHASIVDNLLPALLVTADAGIRLRWVVKRELLTLPSLDVAGKRLPNYFVDRESNDPRRELRRIKALASDLNHDEGVLIYPEGTRYTPRRRKAAVARMRASGDSLLPAAEKLRHVLPPRPGGSLALLDSGADVLVGAHQGLEGFAKLHDLWSGELVGRTVNVRFTRVAAEDIPTGRRQRAEWLYDTWAEIDEWIDSQVEL